MSKKFEITVESGSHEAEEFVAWLIEQGHTAELGDQNEIDGVATYGDENIGNIMNGLWESYCNA